VIRNFKRTAAIFGIVAATSTALVACSEESGSSSDSAAGGSSEGGADAHGPITFAMGKNDTDKVTPIIEKWNEQHPDEKVTLKELADERDAVKELGLI